MVVIDMPMCMIRISEFWCIYSPLAYTLNRCWLQQQVSSDTRRFICFPTLLNGPHDETIGSWNVALPPPYAPLELLASTSHKPKITSGLKPLLLFPLFSAKVLECKCLHTFITCPHARFSTHSNDQHVEIKLKNDYTIHVVMPLFYTLYTFTLRNFLILSTV